MISLPPELIREIVLFFVESRPSQAAALATISRDLCDWVQPILSRTLMYYSDDPVQHWPVSKEKLPQWLISNGKHVRNVMWGIDATDLPEVFSRCPDLTNLAIWVDVDEVDLSVILPSLSTLRLSQFSINLYQLFSLQEFRSHQAQHVAFRTITHLDVFHRMDGWNDIEGVALLPCLTHLCIEEDVDVIEQALRECKHLKVLLVGKPFGIWFHEQDRTVRGDDRLNGYDDPRVVAVKPWNLTDWEHAAIGRVDAWMLADDVVERRRIMADVDEKQVQST